MKNQAIKKVRVVIYTVEAGKTYFLILHRILRWTGWELLKETMEPGETVLETLKRGIFEETKIKDFEIIRDLQAKEKWQSEGNNYEITATYLVRTDKKQEISLKQEIIEHDRYLWAEKDEAAEKLTWPETKALIENLQINGK